MYRVRLFVVRHARSFEWVYGALIALDPLFAWAGYDRIERPVALIERGVKDCSSTARCAANACSPRRACPARRSSAVRPALELVR